MAKPRPLKRPPIVEALVDLQASVPSDHEMFKALAAELNAAPSSDDRGEEILSRLLEALAQAAGSDGTSVSCSAFIKTLDFMMSLPTELPLPAVVVESEDEIGLDWDEDHQRVVSLTIDDSDQIGFSALFGREPHYGRVDCVDGLPGTLRYVLARLYPSTRLD